MSHSICRIEMFNCDQEVAKGVLYGIDCILINFIIIALYIIYNFNLMNLISNHTPASDFRVTMLLFTDIRVSSL